MGLFSPKALKLSKKGLKGSAHLLDKVSSSRPFNFYKKREVK